jgi:hypothetical protein
MKQPLLFIVAVIASLLLSGSQVLAQGDTPRFECCINEIEAEAAREGGL